MTTEPQIIIIENSITITTNRQNHNIFGEYQDIILHIPREKLTHTETIYIKEKFFEAEHITLTYVLAEDEKKCKLSRPEYKVINGEEDDNDDRILRFEFSFDKHFAFCEAFLNIRTKDKKKRSIKLMFDINPKYYADYSNIDRRYNMLNDLRKKRVKIYTDIYGISRALENKILSEPPTREELINVPYNFVKKLNRIYDYISMNPSINIKKEKIIAPIWTVKNIGYNVSQDLVAGINKQIYGFIKIEDKSFASSLDNIPSDKNGCKYLPAGVPTSKEIKNYNTMKNRIFKGFPTVIYKCIKELENRLENERYGSNDDIEISQDISRCRELYKDLEEMRTYQFLDDIYEIDNIDEIKSNMHVLDGDYISLYNMIEEFIKSPVFDDLSNNLSRPLNLTHKLYEDWVIVQEFDILIDLCKEKNWHIEAQRLIDESGYMHIHPLKKGLLIELIAENGKKIHLYHKKGYGKYTGGKPFEPDTSIEKDIGKKLLARIFDPKYRSTLTTGEKKNPENAKNKGSVYKEAITKNHSRFVESSFAIYCGETKIYYASKNRKRDLNGGIRLLPIGNNDDDKNTLKKFILDFIEDDVTDIRLSIEEKRDLYWELSNIYRFACADDWQNIDEIKDKNLKIIKRILYSFPDSIYQYIKNSNKEDLDGDCNCTMMDMILSSKNVSDLCDRLQNAINNKNKEDILIIVKSILYMTYTL